MRLSKLWVLAGCLLAVVAVGCSREESPRYAGVDEVQTFQSLAGMVAGADAIVQGTVVAIEPGRTVGEESGNPVQFQQVTIQVEEVLAGSLPEREILLEEGFGIPPVNSEMGDTGFYFIHLKLDSPKTTPYYRLVNTQGRFLEADGKVLGSNDESSWVDSLEELSPQEFESLLVTTTAQVAGR
jgi:hypothetical protein